LRADVQAGFGGFTPILSKYKLGFRLLTFRIMTPPAFKGATFHENRRANTRAIMNGIAF
jgi:hypothetical protein